MADEILSGSGGGTNILASEVASLYVHELLKDAGNVRNHPALVNLGMGLMGSTTAHAATVGRDGYDIAGASGSEAASVSNTALTTGEKTITVARHALAYEVSDLMASVDDTGITNPQRIAQSTAIGCQLALMDLICNLLDNFATTAGSTTTPLAHDAFLAAKFKLIQNLVEGPYLWVCDQKQFTDWLSDLESRGGSTQWRQDLVEMQKIKGPGFQGTIDNIDIFTSNKVVSSGGAYLGGMFGRGAIAFQEKAIMPGPATIVALSAGPVLVEHVRNGRSATNSVVGSYYAGVVELEDLRGVTVQSVN